jgi:hypothetical protein
MTTAKLVFSAGPIAVAKPAVEVSLRTLVLQRNTINDQIQMAKRQGRPAQEIANLQWQLREVKDQIAATGASPLEIIDAAKHPAPEPPVDTARPHRVDRYGPAHWL